MEQKFSLQDAWQMIVERDVAIFFANREIANLRKEVAALKAAVEKEDKAA